MADSDKLLDEFNAYWGGGPAIQLGGYEDSLVDEFNAYWQAKNPPQRDPMTPLESVGQAGMQVLGQGALMGGGDELLALMGGLNPLDERNYSERLGAVRGNMSAYEQRHPIASMIGQGAGAMVPTIATLGSNAAPSATRQLLGLQPMESINWADRALRYGAAGATQGGVYGFGRGEDGLMNRLSNAGSGAALGGTVGAGLSVLGSASEPMLRRVGEAHRAVSDEWALNPERGSVRAPASADTLDAADKFFIKRALGTQEGERSRAAQELGAALTEGSPLALHEALPVKGVERTARFLANYQPSMDEMQRFVDSRQSGTYGRLNAILDDVTPGRSPVTAGQNLIAAAKGKVTGAEARKVAWGDLAYDKVRTQTPIMQSDAIDELLGSKNLGDAIKRVRSGTWADEVADLPDNSFDVLNYAKQNLDDEINSLSKTGKVNESRPLRTLRKELISAMDEISPEYKHARRGYERFQKVIGEIAGDDRGGGILEGILSVDRTKAESAVDQLMKLSDEDIVRVRTALGPSQEKTFRGAVRGWLQKRLDNRLVDKVGAEEGARQSVRNPVTALGLDKPANRAKIEAALGSEWDDVWRKIQREERIHLGTRALDPKSGTAANLQDMADWKKFFQPSKWKDASIDYLAEQFFNPSDKLAQALAGRFTDSQRALEMLQRIEPHLQRWQAINQGSALPARFLSRPAGTVGSE